jgi:hypothetical protein
MTAKKWHATEPWLGLLTGPSVFLINLQVNFTMVSWVCATHNYWAIHLAHVISIMVVGWSGLLAWRAYARVGRGVPGEAGDAADRERFVAVSGLLISAFSILSLIAHWIPNFILSACQ